CSWTCACPGPTASRRPSASSRRTPDRASSSSRRSTSTSTRSPRCGPASGFLLKDAKPGELVGAIRAVASGDAAVSPRITRLMLAMCATQLPRDAAAAPAQARTGRDDPRLAELTARELEVFEALGEGLTNAEIAERFVLSEATVKTHVGRVLGKLGLRDRVQAVVLAYETGGARPSRHPSPGAEHVVLERPALLTLQNHMFGPGGVRPGRRPPPSPPGGPCASRRGAPRACTAPGRRRAS